MSSYHDAPATKMLATHCALCGQELLDALSVEIGVGPTCRKKAGWSKKEGFRPSAEPEWFSVMVLLSTTTDERIARAQAAQNAHELANAIVHRIALEQTGGEVPALVAALHALGYHKLSEASARGTGVRVTREGGDLVVAAPFNATFNDACRAVPGSWWSAQRKARVVPEASKGALWKAIKQSFPRGTVVFADRVAVL